VRLLSWLSLGAMSVEGVVAIVAGVLAGSIALLGFGLDSAVEGFASVIIIIIWRFTGSRILSETAERRAQKLVALQFFALAPFVAVESVRALLGGERRDVSARHGARGLERGHDAAARPRQKAHGRPARVGGHEGGGAPERPLRLPRRLLRLIVRVT